MNIYYVGQELRTIVLAYVAFRNHAQRERLEAYATLETIEESVSNIDPEDLLSELTELEERFRRYWTEYIVRQSDLKILGDTAHFFRAFVHHPSLIASMSGFIRSDIPPLMLWRRIVGHFFWDSISRAESAYDAITDPEIVAALPDIKRALATIKSICWQEPLEATARRPFQTAVDELQLLFQTNDCLPAIAETYPGSESFESFCEELDDDEADDDDDEETDLDEDEDEDEGDDESLLSLDSWRGEPGGPTFHSDMSALRFSADDEDEELLPPAPSRSAGMSESLAGDSDENDEEEDDLADEIEDLQLLSEELDTDFYLLLEADELLRGEHIPA